MNPKYRLPTLVKATVVGGLAAAVVAGTSCMPPRQTINNYYVLPSITSNIQQGNANDNSSVYNLNGVRGDTAHSRSDTLHQNVVWILPGTGSGFGVSINAYNEQFVNSQPRDATEVPKAPPKNQKIGEDGP